MFLLFFAYLVKLVNTIDLKSVPNIGYRFKSDSKQFSNYFLLSIKNLNYI